MKTVRKDIEISSKTGDTNKTVNVCMEDDVIALGEVTVEARHERKEVTEAKRQGVPVSVIDGKQHAGTGTRIGAF